MIGFSLPLGTGYQRSLSVTLSNLFRMLLRTLLNNPLRADIKKHEVCVLSRIFILPKSMGLFSSFSHSYIMEIVFSSEIGSFK